MADTIILYSSAEHLNSMLLLSNFIAKHHPSISVTILSTVPNSAAEPFLSGVTYHRLTSATIPPNFTKDRLELLFEVPRIHNPNLRQALEEIALKSNIKAIVLDIFCNPAFEVSTSMDIPTYFYVSSGAFTLCVFHYFPTIDERIVEDVGDYNDFLYVPGCPPVHSLDLPRGMFFRKSNIYKYFLSLAQNTRKSIGILVNSFDALEFRAKEALRNGLVNPDGKTPPVYFVGPLINASSGKNSNLSELEPRHECLKWLDSQPSKSVIFLCFGRDGMFSKRQLREIAIGLENSGHRFIWAVRSPPGDPNQISEPDLDNLLPEDFIKRNREKGFIIKKWAPQKDVLNHDSVGGFVTHCGRSSVLEALSFGVPMIGLPMYAEQKLNRDFMVEEMKVALPLHEKGNENFVPSTEVEKRIRELFDSTNGKAIRMRVEELKIAAKAAVEKDGSSVVALEEFVKNVINI